MSNIMLLSNTPFPEPEGPHKRALVGNLPIILYFDCFVSKSVNFMGVIFGVSDISILYYFRKDFFCVLREGI